MLKTLQGRINLLVAILLGLVAIQLLNVQLEGALVQYGIVPRNLPRWHHIFTAPFIHGGYGHLFNNLIGLGIFSAVCLMRSVRFYLTASLTIIVMGGALVWLFGRSATHVGASGWIFGLWSLSIATAWFDRRLRNIALSIVVVLAYGGMIFGVLPTDPGVSFEMHLAGAVAGVFCAFVHSKGRLKYED